MIQKLMVIIRSISERKRNACVLIIMYLYVQSICLTAAEAQSKVVKAGAPVQVGGSQVPSPDGMQTDNTVPNKYEDALGNLYRVQDAVPANQLNINSGVNQILSGYYSPKVFQGAPANIVFQAAEQGQGALVQEAANNIMNGSLGAVNDEYKGLHQFWKDDIVGNLFQNVGQLMGKWLSEFIDGWLADTAQFLAKSLRTFVLNPNVAVNGLPGQPDDGHLSIYIREGADIMYGIAVDLLLLLFILCIWKYWADAAWQGAGNLMGPVGRLIFTAGLLLAWPTIYAFDIQISNEMIQAIYANNPEQVLMLDFALAQIVKGGVIAAGAGATNVFAPILANAGIPVTGSFVGSTFSFFSTMIYTILGGIIIAELVYIIVLKAIQTALLTAQYMFGPIFLVFFATPDTESYATGYVKAFVETSLWTFVWVGLLKIFTIVLFSDYNSWGKILLSIGVLQLMIQVPSFLGRAQISPMSDFVTAGLVYGTATKAIDGLKGMGTGIVEKGTNWFTSDKFADKGLEQTKTVSMNGLAGKSSGPELLHNLNKASETERNRNNQHTGTLAALPLGPGAKVTAPGSNAALINAAGTAAGINNEISSAISNRALSTGPAAKKVDQTQGIPTTKSAPSIVSAAGATTGQQRQITPKQSSVQVPPSKPSTWVSPAITAAGLNALAGLSSSAFDNRDTAAHNEKPDLPGQPNQQERSANRQRDKFEWGKSSAESWNEPNLVHVDTRKFLGKMTSSNGVGLRLQQKESSAIGSIANGVQRINIAAGASDSDMTHAIYSAAFASNVATDDPARDAARKAAMETKETQPRGLMENMAANWLSNTGSSWTKTAMPKQRFQHAMFESAVKGSQAYVSRQEGNAYTSYLKDRYGDWNDEQDAMAMHIVTNPDSSESAWNRNVGPATDALVASGIPIAANTRGAMQNMTIQCMHPTRRKQAVIAALKFTEQRAHQMYGKEDPTVLALAHGEMAKALSPEETNQALAVYHIEAQNDTRASSPPEYIVNTANFADNSATSAGTIYTDVMPPAEKTRRYIQINPKIRSLNPNATYFTLHGEDLANWHPDFTK